MEPIYTTHTEWEVYRAKNKHEELLAAKSEPVGVPVAVIKWIPHVIWQKTEGEDA